jgi:hypothetical protein
MKKLVEVVTVNMDSFIVEAGKTDNKAAAARARKLSLLITTQLKQYRKDSVK